MKIEYVSRPLSESDEVAILMHNIKTRYVITSPVKYDFIPKKENLTMTVSEFALYIHESVSDQSIYRLIHSGKLRAKKIGQRYFITKNAAEEFLSCRDTENPQDSFLEKTKRYGSSSTMVVKSGQDAALISVQKLRKHCANT
jgi:excisionase family DNA binding protein